MSEKMTRDEERELLELEAMLARLKIQAAQAKKKKTRVQGKSSVNNMLNFANTAGNFISNQNLLKLAMLPVRWKHRLLLCGGLMAWEFYRSQQKSNSNNISRDVLDDGDVIDVYPDFKRLK